MRKLGFMIFIGILLFLASGCNDATVVVTTTTGLSGDHRATFDYDALEDVVFDLGFDEDGLIVLEGQNIASGDYSVDGDGRLTIDWLYLARLSPGTYLFDLYSENDVDQVEISVVDVNQDYRIINGSFETGDLSGWETRTLFKAETELLAFRDEMVREKDADLVAFDGEGMYLYGYDYTIDADQELLTERMGILSSSVFELGGNGYISFMLAGGANPDLVYLSVRDANTDQEIARYGNLAHDAGFISKDGSLTTVNLNRYYADLSQHLGKSLYLEFVDCGGRDLDYLIIDGIETYHDSIPSDFLEAVDIMPEFHQGYVTNQLANGNFDNDLDDWTVSEWGYAYTENEQTCFVENDGILKSNLQGDESRGLIRSSLFRVDGSGVISVDLGVASGERYDKDTFISIREANTNREVFRFANRNNQDGDLIRYYVDLSSYMGEYLYLEIVDNATASYDVIYVDNIVTYYATMPYFDYENMAVNLNE